MPRTTQSPGYIRHGALSESLEPRILLATVPSGFTESELLTGLASPTSMATAPDGRVFVGLQNGTVRLVKNDVPVAAPILQLTVDSSAERGLVGIAVDAEFQDNPYLYALYTATTPSSHMRVSRFTLNGDSVVAGSELALLDLLPLGSASFHMGGGIHFGPDLKLYVGIGDHQDTTKPQSLDSPLGKILRVNRDGTIPTDNPFYSQTTGINRAIWARGLRNPYTSAFQPGTGLYFINDVGENGWEEINAGGAGANYGWPTTEGDFNQSSYPNFTRPFHAYQHGPECAITGGDFYNPTTATFPSQYLGKYFFMDFCAGTIKTIDPSTKQVAGFATGISFPNDMRVGSNGSLYYLSRGQDTGGQPATGKLIRISYTGSASPYITTQPVAQTVAVGEPATFSVVAGGPGTLSHQWRRDGNDIPGANAPSYTLAATSLADNGVVFSVRVLNAGGNVTSSNATLSVVAGSRPTATLTSPSQGIPYRGGDTIQYSATADDAEDGALPASAFTWRVDFHHDAHSHPFVAPTSGVVSGSFVVPVIGETDPDVFYRISLTVIDSSGLTFSTFRDVTPRLANITLTTNVAGLSLSLDGQPRTLPVTITGVAGMSRLLTAPSQQTVNGVTYNFVSWSDGGAATHSIAFPDVSTTYIATYSGVSSVFVSDLTPTSATNGWGPWEKDRSNGETGANDGRTITLNGVTFAKGLGVHATSDIRFNLSGQYTRFQAKVGVDDEVGNAGSLIFRVFTDGGLKLFDSGVMTGASATQTVDVDVTGRTLLQLVVDPNGVNYDDHADWADAKLTTTAGPPPPPPPGTIFAAPVSYPTGSNAHGVAAADLNGDGKLDLAVANAGSASVAVAFGNGDGTFGPRTSYSVGSEPKSVFAKDLNGDGKLDLITANQGSATVSVLINNGNGTFANAVAYSSPSGSHEAFAGDLNGDGFADIAVVGWGASVVRILLNNGNGTFAGGINYNVGNAPHSVIGADFDGDGDIDLAVADYGSNNVALMRNNGNGTFQAAVFLGSGAGPHSIRTADLNADGKADLVTANEGSDSVSVFLGNGNFTFAASVAYTAGSQPKGIAIGDVNNDGKLDVVVADSGGNYPNGNSEAGKKLSVLLGNGNGTFGSPIQYSTGHTPFSVVLADFDGDGDLDAASANWISNDVTVLKNITTGGPPINNPPVANDDLATTTTGVAVVVDILANDSDSDGTLVPSTVTITTAPTSGTVTVNTANGRITYTPAAGFTGTDTLFYTVKDNSGGTSNVAKVTIAVTPTLPPPQTVYLSDLNPISATNGWGPYERDRSNGEIGASDGRTITLNGVTFAKGLGTHAASDIRYSLAGQYTRFQAQVGIDDEVGSAGSVIFRVYTDGGVLLFDSGAMTGSSATKTIDMDVTGRNLLQLVVDPNGATAYDHADWADAKLSRGSPVPDTEPPTPPANLNSTGKTSTTVSLAWTASNDNVGVAGYEIYRGATKVGTSTTTSFTDTGLTPNTVYSYTVKAFDAAQNFSTASEPLSVTTNAQSSIVYLSDLNPTSATNGWGPYERDRSNGETGATDGRTITLNGVTYAKGLGVHANSDLRYNVGGQFTMFQAAIGVDDEVGSAGNVIFRVYADGVLIYDSGAMTGSSATKLLNLNVAGVNELRLVVDPNGANAYDHADWADAKLS